MNVVFLKLLNQPFFPRTSVNITQLSHIPYNGGLQKYRTWEIKTGETGFQGQPQLNETLLTTFQDPKESRYITNSVKFLLHKREVLSLNP